MAIFKNSTKLDTLVSNEDFLATNQSTDSEKLEALRVKFTDLETKKNAEIAFLSETNAALFNRIEKMERVIFLTKPAFDALVELYNTNNGLFNNAMSKTNHLTILSEIVPAAISEAEKVGPMVRHLREVGGEYDFSEFCFSREKYLSAVADVTGLGYLVSEYVGPDDFVIPLEVEDSGLPFNLVYDEPSPFAERHPKVFAIGDEVHNMEFHAEKSEQEGEQKTESFIL